MLPPSSAFRFSGAGERPKLRHKPTAEALRPTEEELAAMSTPTLQTRTKKAQKLRDIHLDDAKNAQGDKFENHRTSAEAWDVNARMYKDQLRLNAQAENVKANWGRVRSKLRGFARVAYLLSPPEKLESKNTEKQLPKQEKTEAPASSEKVAD